MEMPLDLAKEIEGRSMHVVGGLGIAPVLVVTVSLRELDARRQREGLQTFLIDGFAPERVGAAIGVITIGGVLVVADAALGSDEGAHHIGCQRLLALEVLVIIEVERGRTVATRSVVIVGRAIERHHILAALGMDICAAYEFGLQHVAAVAEAVGQLGIVAEVPAA